MRRALVALALAAACSAPAQPRTTEFSVVGMVCGSCEQAICAEVQKLEGVEACAADHAAGAASVRHDPERAPAAAIAAAIAKLGYTAAPR